MKFKVKKIKISNEEKERRIKDFIEFEGFDLDNDLFLTEDFYDEFIDFKCLNCDTEAELEADIIYELWDEYSEDFPILTCNKCGKETFVPKDIYKKLKKK